MDEAFVAEITMVIGSAFSLFLERKTFIHFLLFTLQHPVIFTELRGSSEYNNTVYSYKWKL